MGFLAPALLGLGAAIVVPILLHLFQRHQGPRVVFPALRYLRRAEKESARQIRLRQLLLLLLRTAALLLLAFAAARPFLRSSGGQHEPAAVVVILDNSLSSGTVVGDRRVLDVLADQALATLAAAGPDDRFWLIRAGAPWEPPVSSDPITLAARIRETTPTAAAADLGASLAQARSVLAAAADGRAPEIHLLSDLQATNVGDLSLLSESGPALVIWTPSGAPPANRRVAAVEIEGGLTPIAGERATLAVNVEGTPGTDSLAARLALEGRVVAAAIVPAGAAALLAVPPQPAGILTGWVETDPDALRADDRRYFAVDIAPPPAVALTGPQPFVEEALQVLAEAGRIRRTSAAEATVAFLPGGLSIEAVMPGRTAIILPPDAELELPAVNRRLGAAGLAWRYASSPGEGEARFAEDVAADPLLEPLQDVHLTRVYALERAGDGVSSDSTLLRLQDGAAWAVRGVRADGVRYILLGSPLADRATSLPTSAALLPLLDRLIAWSADAGRRLNVAAGATVQLPPGATIVERPGEEREPVEGRTEWRADGEPGLYRVLAGDSLVAVYAVNPPAAESSLDRVDVRELRRALDSWDPVTVDDAGDWGRAVYRRRLGRELWRPLIAVAIALLLAEALVAAAGRTAATPGRRISEA